MMPLSLINHYKCTFIYTKDKKTSLYPFPFSAGWTEKSLPKIAAAEAIDGCEAAG